MKRRASVIILGLLAIAVTAVLVTLVSRPVRAERAYTVAQVNAGLARNPSAWLGRVVSVRGRAIIPIDRGMVRCCATWLVDPDAPAQHIELVWRAVSPWLAMLLRLPLVGSIVAPRIGGTGIYLVRLTQATRITSATGLPDYYPYTTETVVASDDRAVLVNSLN